MIHLHYFPSTASMTPHILLEELGVAFELELVDRTSGKHKTPEYLKLNPNGLIPVLVDGDITLFETAAITLYLVDKFPQAQLAPQVGSADRAHFYKWLVWQTNTLQSALIMYFYPDRYVSQANSSGALEVKYESQKKIGQCLQQLDDQLKSHGNHWILGDTFSAVDIYAFMLCRWTRGFTGDAAKPARDYPHLGQFLQRMLARDSVKRAFATELLQPPYV
jgi:glutathione S-transferase